MGSSIVQDESALPALPPRPRDGHKGTFGRVLIVGGSVGMTGAVALAGEAALRSGSGLVYAAVPASLASTVDAQVRELVVRSANEQPPGHLAAAPAVIADWAPPLGSACIGPRLGRCDTLRAPRRRRPAARRATRAGGRRETAAPGGSPWWSRWPARCTG